MEPEFRPPDSNKDVRFAGHEGRVAAIHLLPPPSSPLIQAHQHLEQSPRKHRIRDPRGGRTRTVVLRAARNPRSLRTNTDAANPSPRREIRQRTWFAMKINFLG